MLSIAAIEYAPLSFVVALMSAFSVLPSSFLYRCSHLHRKELFSHNWQLNNDKTPFFIKYGYIWFFSGFPQRGGREDMMKQTWDSIKGNYR